MKAAIPALVGILMWSCSSLHAQVTTSVSVIPDSLTIGDPFSIIVSARWTSGDNKPAAFDLSRWDSIKLIRAQNDSLADEYHPDISWESNGMGEEMRLDIVESRIVRSGREWLYRDTLTARIWDIGAYLIPAPGVEGEPSGLMEAQSALLRVYPPMDVLPSDSTQMIFPIDSILTVQKSWEDYKWWFWSLLILLVAVALVYIYRKKKNARSYKVKKFEIKIPAHVTALKKLRALEHEALWKKGAVKEHQSRLTHIMREYLENRFGIPALESTTHEIKKNLARQELLPASLQQQLTEILQVADMVKFAKAKPAEDVNQLFIIKAREFVTETMVNEKEGDSKNADDDE